MKGSQQHRVNSVRFATSNDHEATREYLFDPRVNLMNVTSSSGNGASATFG